MHGREWWMLSGLLLFMIIMFGVPMKTEAEERAEFHVQAAEIKDDGMIRVAVYLTELSELGGVEAEFIYDASKVTYIGSGLGRSFRTGIGETNHIPETSTVRGLVIFSEAKDAHGELMYAYFKLKDVESYQPQFKVVDLLDASDAINPVSYIVFYQQADGSWADEQDTSGTKASKEVIGEAKTTYGSDEDSNQEGEMIKGEQSAEELQEEKAQVSGNTKDGIVEKSMIEKEADEKASVKKDAGKAEKHNKDTLAKKKGKKRAIVRGMFLFLSVGVFTVLIRKKRDHQ